MTWRASRPSTPARARRAGLVVLTFVVAVSASAAGQERQIGVRGGATRTTVSNQSSGGSRTFDPRMALTAGGFLTWPIRWVALQPEVLYTSKGAVLAHEGIDARLVLDYVEVPILVSRAIGRIGPARLYVGGGPAFAVRVRARTRTAFSGATEELDLAEEVERSDVGAVLAGALHAGRFVIDGRYTHGLRDIDRDREDEVAVRNRAITISAGVGF